MDVGLNYLTLGRSTKLVSFCVLSKLSYSALNLSENPIKNLFNIIVFGYL